MGLILAILACAGCLNAAKIVGEPVKGKCPPVITTKPDFDYRQFAGVWFEIERMPVVFESGMSCVQATYAEISEGVISVRNTATLANGGFTNITGSATAPYPDQPGYLMGKFPFRKFKTSINESIATLLINCMIWFVLLGPPAGYRVLDTDYKTFASIY